MIFSWHNVQIKRIKQIIEPHPYLHLGEASAGWYTLTNTAFTGRTSGAVRAGSSTRSTTKSSTTGPGQPALCSPGSKQLRWYIRCKIKEKSLVKFGSFSTVMSLSLLVTKNTVLQKFPRGKLFVLPLCASKINNFIFLRLNKYPIMDKDLLANRGNL